MLNEFLTYHKRSGLWWYANCISQQVSIYGTQQATGIVEQWLAQFSTDASIRRFCIQLLDLMY